MRGRWLDALGELADRCAADGELAEAVTHAERLLRADPLREDSYRRLMRLHADRGDPARALGVYHECAAVWERELGVGPSAATRAAYAALLPRETAGSPAAVAAPATLVGRAAERRQLVDLFRASVAGRAQFVLLTGEAGIGKTRLVEEFRTWCARQGAVVAEARCHSAEGPLVYGPVAAWLRSGALRPRLAQLDPGRRSELARLLPELLVEAPDTPKPVPLSADEHRLRLLDAVADAVLAPPAARVLVLDDLQHVDRETCRLVHYLVRREPTARLLIAATARREEIDRDHPAQELLAGLHALDRCTEIELGRLDRAETDAAGARARWRAARRATPLRRDGRQPAVRRRGPAARPGRAGQQARADRARGPARAAVRPGQGARRGGGDDRPRVPRRRAGRRGGRGRRRPPRTASTSSGAGASCASRTRRPTGSATTGSARSPRSA